MSRCRSESGQMAVELAVLMPVIIVCALIIFNLGRFVMLCATFDRVAYDAILAQGVSPAGEQSEVTAVDEVKTCIEEAMTYSDQYEVEVEANRVGEEDGELLSLSGMLTRFRCTLVYRPWPSSFVLAGVPYVSPVELRHERTLVVDRYRPGVVI